MEGEPDSREKHTGGQKCNTNSMLHHLITGPVVALAVLEEPHCVSYRLAICLYLRRILKEFTVWYVVWNPSTA